MSKKQHLLILCVSLGVLAVLAGAICFHAIATQDSKNTAPTEDPAVAALGRYQLTESTFKDYLLLSAMEDGGESTLLAAAQKYAKAQIAAEEIAGTKYAVSEQQKADIQAQEKDSFQRDYEENTAFCITYGITSEDLVRTVITSKINVLVQGQHFSFVIERFLENERKNGKNTDYSAEELLAIYEDYMNKKIAGLTLTTIDIDKMQVVNAYRQSLASASDAKTVF